MGFFSKIFSNQADKTNHERLDEKLDLIISQNNSLLKLDQVIDKGLIDEGNRPTIVNQFSLFEENNQEILKFELVPNEILDHNWKQIPLNTFDQENFKGFLSNVIGGTANVGISSLATNGLFRATADPATLMKLSSGGLGSSVVANGQISSQAGFIQAGSTVFTPLLVFQLASMVTGQYYMNNIAKQLNAIQEKLDELIALFHIERQAKLKKSVIFLNELVNRKNFVIEDFVLIKSIISDLSDIREEYFIMVSNSVEEIKKNNLYSSVNSLSEATKRFNDFKKTGFIEKLKTSIVADELFHFASIVELHMNLCYKNPDINRVNLIQDKLKSISELNIDNIHLNKTNTIYNEVKQDTIKCLNVSLKETWFNESEIAKIKNSLENDFNNFDKEKQAKLKSITDNYNSLIKPLYNSQEILINNIGERPILYMK